MISPYLRTRKIDGGAVAMVRTANAFKVNVWTEDDDTFRDVEVARHDNTPVCRWRALSVAREFFQHILEAGVGARDLVDTWLESAA